MYLLLLAPITLPAQITISGNGHHSLAVGKFAGAVAVPMLSADIAPVRAVGAFWAAGSTINLVDAAVNREKTPFRKEIPALATTFLAGVANGVAEELQHHPDEFLNTFKNANPDFWNSPEETWQNKWLNGDPNQGERFLGSSTLFSATTDGYHAAVGARTVLLSTSIALSGSGGGMKGFLTRTLAHSLAYTIAFESTLKIIK